MTNIIDSGTNNTVIDGYTGVSPGKVVKDVSPAVTSPIITGTVSGSANYVSPTITEASFVGTNTGNGIVPIGGIIPIASNLLGTFSIPASGVVVQGWMYCDGATIPISQIASGATPDLTNNRFLMGSSSAGSIGGSNNFTPTGSLSGSQSIQHTHGFSHTHGTDGQLGTISLNHSHTVNNHTHDLSSHTHSGPNHSHSMSHIHQFMYQDSNADFWSWSNPTKAFVRGGFNGADANAEGEQRYAFTESLDSGSGYWSENVLTFSVSGKPWYTSNTLDSSANLNQQTGAEGTGQTGGPSNNSSGGSSPGTDPQLSNYNALHSHSTNSQSISISDNMSANNVVNGSSFSFTGSLTESRPQYFSVQYIIRVS
jgi:hypothetical protein